MQLIYNKLENELNKFLKVYLADDSYDRLIERLDFAEEKCDQVTEKINDFYNQQLNIDKSQYKDRVRVDRIITFSEKTLNNDKFCKLLVELAQICLVEGKLDLAQEIFKKANKLSTNDFAKAESFLGLA
ncbi:MAG: hypothetical protein HKO83_12310, partial [Ignavibacteriaceae bacterium]|nr:hypothetical protein [Ignavibacteriaceae bacterium]